jgi:hypothetical protein
MTSNGTSSSSSANSGQKSKFDPKWPAAQELTDLHKKLVSSHTDTLSLLANLSIPVVGQTAKSAAIGSTLNDVRAQGDTIKFFGDLFSRFQETANSNDKLSQEEVDQKLLNWALKVPGLKEKFDTLPEPTKQVIKEFSKADLSKGGSLKGKAAGFKLPASPKIEMKMAKLKQMLAEQTKIDGGRKYDSVKEKDGTPVLYVEKFVFENWGETVKNTPAVIAISVDLLTEGDIHSQECSWGTKYR